MMTPEDIRKADNALHRMSSLCYKYQAIVDANSFTVHAEGLPLASVIGSVTTNVVPPTSESAELESKVRAAALAFVDVQIAHVEDELSSLGAAVPARSYWYDKMYAQIGQDRNIRPFEFGKPDPSTDVQDKEARNDRIELCLDFLKALGGKHGWENAEAVLKAALDKP